MAIGLEGSCTPILTNKRNTVSNNGEASPPLKRMSSDEITLNSEMSPLEVLPQHILVKVLCGVDHEDLKQLFHVSKTIREATLLARELRDAIDMEEGNRFLEIEAPNAPVRPKRRLNLRNIKVSVALFADTKTRIDNGWDQDENCE